MNKLLAAVAYLGASLSSSFSGAQTKMDPHNIPAGDNVTGKVTAVTSDAVVVAPKAGGTPVTVHVSDSTRIFKGREAAKLAELKVNEEVLARGVLTGDSMNAAILVVMSPEMLQLMQQLNPGAKPATTTPAGAVTSREDLGKKFIAGQVKSISGTKLTILRPDKQTQEIAVDENTSFKKGNESITLLDIKAEDFVFGPGTVQNGTFVPKQLNVGQPAGTAPDHSAGDSSKPADASK